MSNPLLTPQQNAELTALRNANAGSVSHWEKETDNAPALSNDKWAHIQELLSAIQQLDLFKHVTNGIGLLAVLFYAVNFSNVMASDNHIYAVYQLFPVLASLAIVTTLWTTPANSLLRVLYIVGLYTISWMGV